MLAQLALILLLSMVLGAVLLALGIRGKRLNKHPTCRDCSFDLVAIPEGTITCPECGAGLRRPKAIRIGQRRKRPLFLGLGGLLVFLPLAPIGGGGYALLAGKDIYAWKPVGLLLWEADRAGKTEMPGIAAELHKRYTAGTLAKDQMELILAKAFAMQASHSRPWTPEWAEIIDQANTNNTLSKDQIAEFRKHAPVLKAEARQIVRIGDPIPVRITLKESRVANTSSFQCMLWFKEAKLGETKLKRSSLNPWEQFQPGQNHLGWWFLAGARAKMWGWGANDQACFMLLTIPQDLAPGRHSMAVTVLTKTSPQNNRGGWSMSSTMPKGNDVKEHTFTLLIDVVPPESAVIHKVSATPEIDRELALALNPSENRIHSGQWAMQQFSLEGIKVPLAHEVVWKSGDHEWIIGSLTTSDSAASHNNYGPGMGKSRWIQGQIQGFKGGTIDVILRPSEKVLATTIDQTRLYDGEIVLKGVEVQVQDNGVGSSVIGGIMQFFFR